MAQHIVWDWNGTLLDDFPATVGAQNALAAHGWGWSEMAATEYQARFRRPLQPYYEDLAGRSFSDHEWADLQAAWLGHYLRLLEQHGLASDAQATLTAVTEAGATQSVCSMMHEDHLLDALVHFEVDHHFLSVLGNDGAQHHKDRQLVRHLERVHAELGTTAIDAVIIGDTLDDAHAADHAGIACVLVTTGEMTRDRLTPTGYPVTDSLTEAIEVALGREGRRGSSSVAGYDPRRSEPAP